MFKLVLNNTIYNSVALNTTNKSNSLLRSFSKLSIQSNSSNNNKLNNCKCTNCVCNCKCTKDIYSNNKRYYSSSSAEKTLKNEEDSKIGYATSESNKKKLVESFQTGLKSKQDYLNSFKQETIGRKEERNDEFTVKTAIPRPEEDEIYQHPFMATDLANQNLLNQRPNSNEEQEILPFFDNTRFSTFTPVRPRIQETLIVNGAAIGYSKRKRSRAVVTIKPGNGELLVNGRTIFDYFPSISYRDTVIQPLVITETLVKWNVSIRAFGGGLKGQCEAIRRALSMALVNYDLGYRPALKISGLLKSDSRKVERKKPGQLKARKKFPLVKR